MREHWRTYNVYIYSLYHCACVVSEQIDSLDLDETESGIIDVAKTLTDTENVISKKTWTTWMEVSLFIRCVPKCLWVLICCDVWFPCLERYSHVDTTVTMIVAESSSRGQVGLQVWGALMRGNVGTLGWKRNRPCLGMSWRCLNPTHENGDFGDAKLLGLHRTSQCLNWEENGFVIFSDGCSVSPELDAGNSVQEIPFIHRKSCNECYLLSNGSRRPAPWPLGSEGILKGNPIFHWNVQE